MLKSKFVAEVALINNGSTCVLHHQAIERLTNILFATFYTASKILLGFFFVSSGCNITSYFPVHTKIILIEKSVKVAKQIC